MNDYDRAREDLTKAKKLEPANKAIDEQLKLLESRQQVHNAKYKDALKSMFGGQPWLNSSRSIYDHVHAYGITISTMLVVLAILSCQRIALFSEWVSENRCKVFLGLVSKFPY